MNDTVKNDEKHSVNHSGLGANAYILKCEPIDGTRSYCACLSIINMMVDGDPDFLNPDCNNAISKGACPAVGMREKEEAAGQAMFFQPRDDSWKTRRPNGAAPFTATGAPLMGASTEPKPWEMKESLMVKKAKRAEKSAAPIVTAAQTPKNPTQTYDAKGAVNKLMEEHK